MLLCSSVHIRSAGTHNTLAHTQFASMIHKCIFFYPDTNLEHCAHFFLLASPKDLITHISQVKLTLTKSGKKKQAKSVRSGRRVDSDQVNNTLSVLELRTDLPPVAWCCARRCCFDCSCFCCRCCLFNSERLSWEKSWKLSLLECACIQMKPLQFPETPAWCGLPCSLQESCWAGWGPTEALWSISAKVWTRPSWRLSPSLFGKTLHSVPHIPVRERSHSDGRYTFSSRLWPVLFSLQQCPVLSPVLNHCQCPFATTFTSHFF